MKFLIVVVAMLAALIARNGFAQTVITNSYQTGAGCGTVHTGPPIQICGSNGNFVLGGAIGGAGVTSDVLDLSGNNITVDLAGFNVSGGATTCTPKITSPYGNTCTGSAGSYYGIYVSGKNVTIKNGTVSNIDGTCIVLGGDGGVVSNVTVRSCHGDGISMAEGLAHQVTAEANLVNGISSSGGTVELSYASYNDLNGYSLSGVPAQVLNSSANFNYGDGVFLYNGLVSNVTASLNGTGFYVSSLGHIQNSLASGNTNAGVNFPSGAAGDVMNTASVFNGTYGFTLSSSTCYLNVTTTGNTSGSISGGNAFATGGVCAH